MGSVTKTIVECTGSVSISTTYSFECYEDFAKWEKANAAFEVPSLKEYSLDVFPEVSNESTFDVAPEADEDGWIMHDGKGLPEPIFDKTFDLEYKDGTTFYKQFCVQDFMGWVWDGIRKEDQVLKYRIHKES